ncbi:MAG: SO_0444 family Cu/Zn efflux transporter, partial [bacterium]|nr:SO_0444 family Cu/Zn efflux transporter [bacterium]
MDIIYGILVESWKILQESAIYFLFGFLMAGILYILVPAEKVARYLGGKGIKPVIRAALFGIPIPLCSCGVLPAGISLRKQGASKGASMAFMIATPETGIDSIALTYALIDPIITLFRPISAFFTALVAGFMNNWISKNEPEVALVGTESSAEGKDACGSDSCGSDSCGSDSCGIPVSPKVSIGFFKKLQIGLRYAFVDLMGETAKWFALGILLAGMITYFVPTSWVDKYLGNTLLSMLVMLIIGMPLYVCASSSTPITAALILKGLNPGAALVFLLTGPATNAAAIPLIARYFGKKSTIIYLLSIAGCAVLCGVLLNQVYFWLGITPKAIVGKAGEIFPPALSAMAAILLVLLMANGWARNKIRTQLKAD